LTQLLGHPRRDALSPSGAIDWTATIHATG